MAVDFGNVFVAKNLEPGFGKGRDALCQEVERVGAGANHKSSGLVGTGPFETVASVGQQVVGLAFQGFVALDFYPAPLPGDFDEFFRNSPGSA